MDKLIKDKIESSDVVLLPKGENRTRVIDVLQQNDVIVPSFAGRCLHR